MGQLITHAMLLTTVNGSPLLQAEKYHVGRDMKNILVETIALGVCGVSRGSAMIAIDVTEAVPAAGFDFDPGLFMDALIPVTACVQGPGGQTLMCPAYVMKDDLEQSANAKASHSFQMVGPMQQWQRAPGA